MDLKLKGRTVLITGASRGIGRATADAFAAEGANLHLVARGLEGLQQASNEIKRDHGTQVSTHAIDLAQAGATEALFKACPNPEIVINNAGGIPGRRSALAFRRAMACRMGIKGLRLHRSDAPILCSDERAPAWSHRQYHRCRG